MIVWLLWQDDVMGVAKLVLASLDVMPGVDFLMIRVNHLIGSRWLE